VFENSAKNSAKNVIAIWVFTSPKGQSNVIGQHYGDSFLYTFNC